MEVLLKGHDIAAALILSYLMDKQRRMRRKRRESHLTRTRIDHSHSPIEPLYLDFDDEKDDATKKICERV